MDEAKKADILFGEGVKEKLDAAGIYIFDDGTFSYKGQQATPVAVHPSLDLTKLETLQVSHKEGKENTFLFSYMLWPIEFYFEVALAKDRSGRDMMYVYIPKEEEAVAA